MRTAARSTVGPVPLTLMLGGQSRVRGLMHGEFILGALVMLLVTAGITIPPCWRICRRVGLPPALSLIAVIPVTFLGVLAFAEWPTLDKGDE